MLSRRVTLDLCISLVLVFSLVCLVKRLWRQERVQLKDKNAKDLQKGQSDNENDFDYLYELDQDIIFTDKNDYQMAIRYQNEIFKNGLTASIASDSITTPMTYEEAVRPTEGVDVMTNDVAGVNATNPAKELANSQTDDEERIDQNPVVEQFQNEINGKVRAVTCSPENPLKNVILIKTHRTGSSTLGNVLYRYGEIRNLSFVLPTASSFQYYWPLRFHVSHTRLDLLNRGKPNMAVNIGRFNRRQVSSMMMNDSFVIAILRNPVDHFESVYEYADISKLIGLWNTTRDPFGTFLDAPKNDVIEFVQNSKSFAIELNMLRNGMSFDLGLEQKSFTEDEKISEFVDELSKKLNLVLIADYFDESLVLLKRLLCWDLEDIIYVKQKMRSITYKNSITSKQREKILSWNRADVMLYEHFNKSLWDKIGEQDQSFFAEVDELRAKVDQIKTVCFQTLHEKGQRKTFEVPLILSKTVPRELKEICNRLQLREKEYVQYLKEKQRNRIATENSASIDKSYYKDLNNSRILYELEDRNNFNLTDSKKP